LRKPSPPAFAVLITLVLASAVLTTRTAAWAVRVHGDDGRAGEPDTRPAPRRDPQAANLPDQRASSSTLNTSSVKVLFEQNGYPGISPSPTYTGPVPRVREYAPPMPSSPVQGTRHILVILIDFPDHVGEMDPSHYETLLFSEEPGSVKHYLEEVSYGKLTIDGVIAGSRWYRSTHNSTWWGADGDGLDNANGDIYELAREAVVLSNVNETDVDYKEYDTNDNNVLEPEELCICVVHAGPAQEESGSTPSDIWSHYHWIHGKGYQASNGSPLEDTVVDGVRVSQHHPADYVGGYTMQAETSPLGTFAHEFGHHLGLPDLYDFTGSEEFIGRWDLMGTGNWNGLGTSPAHLCSWSKARLGWIDAANVVSVAANQAVNVTIDQLELSSSGTLVVNLTMAVTYFLVEVRTKTLYDAWLPDEGVLVLLCNDARETGTGPVRVQDAHPGTAPPQKELDDAPFDIGNGENDTYASEEAGITVSLLQAYASTYLVRVNYNASIFEIRTDPSGLRIEVDGVEHLSPQTFIWAGGSNHTVSALALQSGAVGTRYLFKRWSDEGEQHHDILVDSSDVILTAEYDVQFFLNVSSPYGEGTGTGWYVSGATAKARLDSGMVANGIGSRLQFAHWSGDAAGSDYGESDGIVMNAAKTAIAVWKRQYRTSVVFTTRDGVTTFQPTRCLIVDSAEPSERRVEVTEFSGLWLDQGNWTVISVRWQGNEVVVAGEPFAVATPALWELPCRVYTVNFSQSFVNSEGEPLSETPSSFSLACPNGTTTKDLAVGTYLLQNGTFTWQMIRWRGHDVISPTVSRFEVSDGDPTVVCAIYDMAVVVIDYLGRPLSNVEVTATALNGFASSTRSDVEGRTVFTQLPQGEYTVDVELFGVPTEKQVRLDAAVSVEIRVLISPLTVGLLLGGMVLVIGVSVLIRSKQPG
jgi:M6 family metalloprotease-like protein